MTTQETTTAGPSFEEELAALAPALVEHFNGTHPDLVSIVCRAHVGRDDVVASAVTAITADSVSLRATTAAGSTHDVTVAFSRPAGALVDVTILALELTAAARAVLGITEPTAAELEAEQMTAIRTHVTTVRRVEQITPSYRQITFGGGDLATFAPGGLDQFIYVLAPPPGRRELTIDASFTWEQYGQMPEEDRPIGAYYTLRRWRPDAAEIDMLFVLHGVGDASHGSAGPTATWAAGAKPGDPVALWGPRTAYEPPADTDWLLLVGDETGLPAISVILENRPEGMPAHVVVELGDDADRLPLPDSPDVHVTWLIRGDAPAGTTTLLADAVRALDLLPGNVYAWGGAESRAVTAVRKYLRRERGIEQSRVCMVGYWRHAATTDAEFLEED